VTAEGTGRTRRRAAGAVLAIATLAAVAAPARGQPVEGTADRQELVRLDTLLAAGDAAQADALLVSLAPELAKDDRLAYDTIYVLVRRGRIAEARAQWNRLATRLQETLRAQPGEGEAGADGRRRLGEALFTQALLVAQDGGKDEALKLLGQADGYGFPPLDSPLMLLAADCLRGLNEYGLAASAYREFLARSPSSVPAHMGLATTLYAARKFDAARLELEELLRRAPSTAGAEYLLGAVLVELNRYEEARAHLERELGLDPRCLGCLSRLAHVEYLEGRDPECERLLARAAALDPNDVETRMVSGLLAFRAGRYDAAVGHLSFVVERSPAYMAARYQLAVAYRRVGNAEKAREHLQAYQRLLDEQKAREIGFRGQE
jgi:tetratricopeptide (TPR) repeat protein